MIFHTWFAALALLVTVNAAPQNVNTNAEASAISISSGSKILLKRDPAVATASPKSSGTTKSDKKDSSQKPSGKTTSKYAASSKLTSAPKATASSKPSLKPSPSSSAATKPKPKPKPSSDSADNADKCTTTYKFFFDHFEIYGKDFAGDDETNLQREIGGCGAVTKWSFEKLKNDPSGMKWLAKGNLPIGTKSCVGKAVVKAGGNSPDGCTGAG